MTEAQKAKIEETTTTEHEVVEPTKDATPAKKAEPESEVDHKAEISKWVDQNVKTDEDRANIKASAAPERIGRQVSVTVEVNGESATFPRQDLIQVLFEKDWHRSAILKIFTDPVTYQIIFAATKGMQNAHHKEGTTASNGVGRGAKTYKADLGAGEVEVTRKELFKYLIEAKGLSRADIVKYMKETYQEDIAYPTVFQATKDLDVPKAEKKEKAPKADKANAEATTKNSTDKAAAKAAKAAAKGKKNAEPAPADPADDDESAGRDEKLSL